MPIYYKSSKILYPDVTMKPFVPKREYYKVDQFKCQTLEDTSKKTECQAHQPNKNITIR